MKDRPAILDLRRAAAHERRRLADERWRRFQAASLRRNGPRAARVPSERLALLLARGKLPGRALLLGASGVWRADLETALGAAGGETSGLLDYVRAGPDPSVQPRALFDQAWYLEGAPGLAGGRWAPLAHYLVLGDLEGRSPHPLLDPRRARRPGSRLSALQDFLFEGAAAGRDPHPLFDLRHYVGQCEAVARTGENPLVHYLREGWRERLDPHPLFANAWYLGHAPGAAEAGVAPLLHYVTRGAAAGADPHPLFEAQVWGRDAQRPGAADDPLSAYLASSERAARSPGPRFDPVHYLAQAGEAARADPLRHYLTVGTYEGLSPSPAFDEAAWFAANPGAAGEARSGLELAFRRGPARPIEAVLPRPVEAARPLRPGSGPGSADVTVVGYPFSPAGMGEHLRVTLRALQAAGLTVRLVDVAQTRSLPDPAWAGLGDLLVTELGSLNVFCVNGDEADRVVERLGRAAFDAAVNVIYPAWELARYPEAYARAVSRFDEVWAPSAFVRDAIDGAVDRPVHTIPLAVEPAPPPAALGRLWFGVPEGRFTVLFFFDFASHPARKNPEAVLAAVERLLARRPDADLHCVIKVRGVPPTRAARDAFEARVAALGDRAQVLGGDFSDEEMRALIAACDVFVSLHRSEGFGRGPAEAMALGRPTIATGYSGNVDFMPPSAALLVDYALTPVPPGAYPHGEGQVWAEPSVEHASRLIEQLLDDPAAARLLAERGRTHVAGALSYAAVGARLRARVQALGARRQTARSSDR
ncbi:glycosyltransferase family 4 protein [Phenylobacterium sp.]|uniref:glycosyltransferase family 4 protein n=1 Tax=Phenylobacterium sp. TaxID=1871053 RepID=UPI0035AECAC3